LFEKKEKIKKNEEISVNLRLSAHFTGFIHSIHVGKVCQETYPIINFLDSLPEQH